MIRKNSLQVLAAAALAGGLTGLCAASLESQAQSRATQIGPQPGPFSTVVQPAPRPRAADQRRTVDERDAAPDLPPVLRSTDPGNEPTTDPDDDVRPPQSGRPIPIDGDPNWPPEPEPVRDGLSTPGEQAAVPDGIDPQLRDTRAPDDYAPFEQPAAGHDPDAFSVEFEPILDRRPTRLYRFEPFDPVGVRVGSFTVLPEAEVAGASFSNLFRSSSNVRSDQALEVKPTIRLVSNWKVHALEVRATGLTSFHSEFSSENDRAYGLEARGRIDVTRRTNVELLAGFDQAQEARGSINAVSRAGDRTTYDTTRMGVAFNQRFNRLSFQLRGTVTEYNYDPVTTETGSIASNAERNYAAKEAAFRASYDFKPELAVFGEVLQNLREYQAAPAADGVKRDSTGERYRAGITFGNTNRRLRGEVSIGFARQIYDDPRLPQVEGTILDANLAWRVSGLTSVLFTARSDVSETTLPGSGGGLSRSAGVEVRHAFQRRLIGTAGVRTTFQDYDSASLSEREIASTLGLEYYLNREVTLFSRYQHVEFDSTNLARNFNADEIRVGFRIRH